MKFIHLHNHSDYSILDGAITIDKMVQAAVNMEMPGIALTDHGNMFGAVEFYQKATAAGIKPIIGQEFYMAPGSRHIKQKQSGDGESAYHLLLLAENFEGYKNLVKLSSIGYTEGFYYKPRIDWEVLQQHSRGLICGSACIGGQIPVNILRGRPKEAREVAGRFKELFGPERFYLEMQNHGLEEQAIVNRELVSISGEMSIPLIATNDAHYMKREDAFSHEVLLCIQTGKTLNDENRMKFATQEFYLKSTREMEQLFTDYPDALYNTHRIYEMVDCQIPLGNAILPHFEVPDGFNLDTYLAHLVHKGAEMRFGAPVPEKVRQRNEYELSVITSMQFSGYFLIVWDFINYARSKGIPVGPGRGSAAGSMVSYCLEITDLDPLRYNLLFERFLNPDRNEMPDMDIDFCAIRREEVIDYVKEKYGDDRVSQIITFNRMKAKAVIKDVARVLDIPFQEANKISKLITTDTLEEALKTSKEFQNLCKQDEIGKQLIDISLTLEGLARSAGKHAAGVVISRDPLTEYVPLYKDPREGSISSQYEKGTLEAAGLVKMDFLGLKNLTIIDRCLKFIREEKGIDIDITQIPLDDPKTFELLQTADTRGVFQLESGGMQNILRKLSPTTFEEIIAIVALYRPGPLDSGMVDEFIRRKHNPEEVSYLHESLEEILKDTLGVIVYQEQVMLISQVMGGFSLPEADKLRKAMSKKEMEIIDQMETTFSRGAVEQKIDKKVATEIYDMMRNFGRYGFNKSHSAAYALVSYQTAYLKAHYPVEYMTALLSSQPDNTVEVVKYYTDCKSNGITVLPPNVNSSVGNFSIENGSIRFGMSAIKGIGSKVIDSIVEAREKKGPFANLADFLERVPSNVLNRGAFEALIKSGALDSLHKNRAQLFFSIESMIEDARRLHQDRATGQCNLFSFNGSDSNSRMDIELVKAGEWPDSELLLKEKDALGLYISGHPLSKYADEISKFACTPVIDLEGKLDKAQASMVGVISNLQVKNSKKGKRFATGTIEDLTGSIEALFFPKTYAQYESIIHSEEPVYVQGTMKKEEGTSPGIIVDQIQPLRQMRARLISELHITINPVGTDENVLTSIKNLLKQYHGDCPVYFHVKLKKDHEEVVKAHPLYHIMPNEVIIRQLSEIVGQESIQYSIGCSA